MIALSSHRPFSQSPEYAVNQERAAKTWHQEFSNIYYFGAFESELDHENVLFVRTVEQWPTIRQMAEFASHLTCEYVAIINADIVVTSDIGRAEKAMSAMALPAATSYRHTFLAEDYPNLDNAIRHKEDRGMDIFVTKPNVWGMISKIIPACLRIGNGRWDSWLCGYFCHNMGYGFREFTDYRCIFHPKHDGRVESPFAQDIAKAQDDYFTRAKRPSPL